MHFFRFVGKNVRLMLNAASFRTTSMRQIAAEVVEMAGLDGWSVALESIQLSAHCAHGLG